MKGIILVALFALGILFSSCGNWNRIVAQANGYSEVVVDGVVYLQFPSGVTVKYNKDGTIYTRK